MRYDKPNTRRVLTYYHNDDNYLNCFLSVFERSNKYLRNSESALRRSLREFSKEVFLEHLCRTFFCFSFWRLALIILILLLLICLYKANLKIRILIYSFIQFLLCASPTTTFIVLTHCVLLFCGII